MMKQQNNSHKLSRTLILLILTGSLNLLACVSVSIGNNEVERADGVKYTAPEQFKEEDLPHVDKAWKNTSNGNSISFLSDCKATSDPSLENLRSGVISGLNEVEILNEDFGRYNGRAALRSEVSGYVDGIKSKFDLMIFKKNGCIYILTYVALADTFDEDHKAFKNFLEGFKAP